jgi:hypothetical protein
MCKHQIAVLYTIQIEDDGKSRRLKVKPDKVNDVLSRLTLDELRHYIKELTEEDEDSKKHFLSAFATKTCKTVEDFKGIVEQALRPLKRTHGFVHPQEFFRTMTPIKKLIDNAESCVHNGDFEIGINIYIATLEKLVPALDTIDDSSGILGDMVSQVFLQLKLLREYEPPQSIISGLVKYAIKKSTSANLRGSDFGWEYAEVATELASSQHEDQIRKMIVNLKQEGKGNEFIEWYSAERAATILLHFFFNTKSLKEVEAFIDQNLKFHSIKKIAINKAIRDQKFDRALALIEEGIKEAQQAKHPGTVNELRQLQLEVYLQQHDNANIISTAELLFHNSRFDLRYYYILKEHLDKDRWRNKNTEYKRMLEKAREFASLAEISKEEDDQEELVRILGASNNIGLVQEYESDVAKKFRPQLQQIYFSNISASLESRADRSNYRYNARLLKKMLKEYDNSAVVTFTKGLRERYKLRRALLEELAVIPVQ